jgi:hypothetical protein
MLRNASCALVFCAILFSINLSLFADPPGAADYQLIIGGFYHGTGTGNIHGNILDLNGTVTTDDGGSGTFVATKIHAKGNHFTATGTVCGHSVTLDGRFDQPPAHGRGRPGTGRLTITFSVDDGHLGRIVGIQN